MAFLAAVAAGTLLHGPWLALLGLLLLLLLASRLGVSRSLVGVAPVVGSGGEGARLVLASAATILVGFEFAE